VEQCSEETKASKHWSRVPTGCCTSVRRKDEAGRRWN